MFRIRLIVIGIALSGALAAQMTMPMPMPQASADSFLASILAHAGSGTSAEPASTPAAMLMTERGEWRLMLHGEGFLSLQQQTGARGFDKLFSTNWLMGMAERPWGPGQITFRAMLSAEPATVTDRRYSELFQTGETAFGRPIVDGQHPHNFFMELAALYDLKVGEHGLLSLYAAPMGDPAIGPTAFPHRASASEDPIATLGHHLEDSTHIAADVVTVGAAYRIARVEASAFHGREPDERRWRIQSGALDSWSARLIVNPAPNWSGQYSWARIKSPEALHPAETQIRMTASLMYNRPLTDGNWANTLLWGRTRDAGGGNIFNGYLLESNVGFGKRNHAWTRIENVDKPTELALGEHPEPPGFVERFLGRVQAYSFGYSRELPSPAWLATAVGAQWTLHQTPDALASVYGRHPQGLVVFLRLRLGYAHQ